MTTVATLSIPTNDDVFEGYLALPESGSGPAIVLLQEIFGINAYMRDMAQWFAEEGYVALVPDLFWRLERGVDLEYDDADMAKAMSLYRRFDPAASVPDIEAAVDALRAHPAVTGGVGAVGYCLGGLLAYLTAEAGLVDCAVSYYGVGVHEYLHDRTRLGVPFAFHFAGQDAFCPPEARRRIQEKFQINPDVRCYDYPEVDHAFATHGRDSYNKPAASMAYTRTLRLLRGVLGPEFDLEAIWDEHTRYEFDVRDVGATMSTMVAQPYVNHVPTMTGGVGYEELARFYQYHFVNANPEDTSLTPVSRTVGVDRIVDEMLFSFTHDREIDWMLPGIPPTGRRVSVPLVAIVNIRGGKLYHEHIYWDQASVLVQLGLLDPSGIPVAGDETARKLLDEKLPSNTLMTAWSTSERLPIP